MKKSKYFFIAVGVFGLITLVCLIKAVTEVASVPLDYRIFADFEELKKLNNFAVKELEDEDDIMLKGIEYEAKFAKEIVFKNKRYPVFAYKFNNIDDAKRYCSLSENNSKIKQSFSFSYNSMSFIAFQNEYAYRVSGADYQTFAEFYNFMVEDFSIEF